MKIDEGTKERIRKMLRKKRDEFEGKLTKAQDAFRGEISVNNRASVKSHTAECFAPSVNGNRLENLEKCLRKINEAIQKVNQDTYGICENCGEQIPLGRLEAVPWTDHCIFCKNLLSNGRVGVRRS